MTIWITGTLTEGRGVVVGEPVLIEGTACRRERQQEEGGERGEECGERQEGKGG